MEEVLEDLILQTLKKTFFKLSTQNFHVSQIYLIIIGSQPI